MPNHQPNNIWKPRSMEADEGQPKNILKNRKYFKKPKIF